MVSGGKKSSKVASPVGTRFTASLISISLEADVSDAVEGVPTSFLRMPSSPPGGTVTLWMLSREICEMGSNVRNDSSSSPKNSSRTGHGLVSGKMSTMPPRNAISPL